MPRLPPATRANREQCPGWRGQRGGANNGAFHPEPLRSPGPRPPHARPPGVFKLQDNRPTAPRAPRLPLRLPVRLGSRLVIQRRNPRPSGKGTGGGEGGAGPLCPNPRKGPAWGPFPRQEDREEASKDPSRRVEWGRILSGKGETGSRGGTH